jgi:hypothetical protein
VAELVDALASGASGGNPVEVQVLFSAPIRRAVMRVPYIDSLDTPAAEPLGCCLRLALVFWYLALAAYQNPGWIVNPLRMQVDTGACSIIGSAEFDGVSF